MADLNIMNGGTKGAASPGRDLPQQLLNAGWRKFFSKREQRPYYFNKVTNQSLWEAPTLGSPSQTFYQDPLGIATPSPSAVMSPPPLGDARQQTPKRRHSSVDSAPPNKKPNLEVYWNLEVPTNVIIHEREMSNMYPPHPDVELIRTQLINKLRQQYEETCFTREGIHAPAESFNRWLLERKVVDRATGTDCDPILASDCEADVSLSMKREILNDIPIKLVKPKFLADARRQLTKYAEGAKKVVETREASPETRKVVKWNVEDTFSWVRKQMNASYEDYLERLAHLKRQCQPLINEASSSSIDSICRKMYNIAREDATKLSKISANIWKDHDIQVLVVEVDSLPLKQRRKVLCYPRLLGTPSPRLPTITINTASEITSLKYKDEVLTLKTSYFSKLEQLYKLSCKDDPRFELFLARVWCLLRRYQTYYGIHKGEGLSLQAALPIPVFECLNRLFGVTFECFASPLNCYYKQYCSAFSDTDAYFGSRGPILDFHPISGSFEANPPFSEELMETMVNHFETLLERSDEPLSFVICVPEWRDPPTKALIRLETSSFTRKQFVVPAMEHEYRHGFQHVCPKEEMGIKSSNGTLVLFLQNDAGFKEWTPTPEKVTQLAMSFTSSMRHKPSSSSSSSQNSPSL